MNKLYKFGLILLISAVASGCANYDIKPGQVLCPILGATLGAGIAGGGLGSSDGGALAGGAVVGAALGHFLCMDRPPPPRPKAAPRAPAPKPKPKPAPPKDTDGDGVIDANDECPGTPAGVEVNEVGCPKVGEKLITFEGVNFDTNSANIKADSEGILDNAVTVLNENASVHVRVEGHTDSRGSASYNKTLSENRANAVIAYLVSKGIAADRLSAIGYGEAAPVAPNDSPENMYKNRRVDLVVTAN
jgi:OOP family OmpA-OmpF porin